MSFQFQVDCDEFGAAFRSTPVSAAHSLADSGLFEWERIRRLARELPADSMQIHDANVDRSADPVCCQLPDRDPVAAVDALPFERVSVCFAGVEFDPGYRAILEACIGEIRPSLGSEVVEPRAYLLLSSPHAVHPYHLDSNFNFLLHVQGEKTIHIWNPGDREVLSEDDLDYTFAITQRLRFDERFMSRGHHCVLSPGQAVFLPSLAPHYVENGPEISVTLSVAFNTPESIEQQILHRVNGNLRRIGIHPSPVGIHRGADRLKYAGFRAARRIKHALRS